ncbi:MAG: hypothetical protein ACRDMV_18290 [Streptosporangiales bacterium]
MVGPILRAARGARHAQYPTGLGGLVSLAMQIVGTTATPGRKNTDQLAATSGAVDDVTIRTPASSDPSPHFGTHDQQI